MFVFTAYLFCVLLVALCVLYVILDDYLLYRKWHFYWRPAVSAMLVAPLVVLTFLLLILSAAAEGLEPVTQRVLDAIERRL